MSRRRFLHLAGGGAALVLAGPAAAGVGDAAAKQALPTRTTPPTSPTPLPARTYASTDAATRHRRHRREALDGEGHLPEDSFELCERDCTVSIRAHEYEGRS